MQLTSTYRAGVLGTSFGRSFGRSAGGRVIAVALMVVAAVGCDGDFEPFVDTNTNFTIAGFLDTEADVQVVRVVPIRSSIGRPQDFPDRPDVFSTDLTTGNIDVWSDTTVTLSDGSPGLVYLGRFRAQAEHRYRLEVTGDRGSSTAEVTVPPAPGDPNDAHTIPFPSLTTYPILWPGVDNVIATDVFYRVTSLSGPPAPQFAWLDYAGSHRGRSASGEWIVDMRFIEDRVRLNDQLGITGEVALNCLVVRLTEPSDGWQPPPGGTFDRDVLIQPGVFSNVTNGLGWWGAVSRSSFAWTIRDMEPNVLLGLEYLPSGSPVEFCFDLARDAHQRYH